MMFLVMDDGSLIEFKYTNPTFLSKYKYEVLGNLTSVEGDAQFFSSFFSLSPSSTPECLHRKTPCLQIAHITSIVCFSFL